MSDTTATATTTSAVLEAIARRWPDNRFLHVYEAPTTSDRQGRKIDVLILSLWHSDRHEIDAVEVKVSYNDWTNEWRRVIWKVTDHQGRVMEHRMKPNDRRLAALTAGTPEAGRYWRSTEAPPEGFVPTVERIETVHTVKSQDWRARSDRFWIAAPTHVAQRIADDVARLPELAGWGVLAVDDTGGFQVLAKPAQNRARQPFTHAHWLGIVRAAADSGFHAIQRAEARGRAEARAEAARLALQRLSIPA